MALIARLGKYTYQDNLPKEKMAAVCMENYDTEFTKLTKPGDVLVTGFNFGCGKWLLFSPYIITIPFNRIMTDASPHRKFS